MRRRLSKRWKWCIWVAALAILVCTAGCGTFFARRMAQAPNTYPQWLAPPAPVELAFDTKFLTNFPMHFIDVGPPPARLLYRIVEPADYNLKVSSTNWMVRSRPRFRFSFDADVPGATNAWTHSPRGTAILLHGYGVAQFAMSPWALRLAQEGWRCVLVDLRGHGKATGKWVYFGTQEARDLTQLLNHLEKNRQLAPPVSAVGESYGAALALRWKASDSRIGNVVAIAPYANLSNAVLNISREYSSWLPLAFLRAGLKRLPAMLDLPPEQFNPADVLRERPVTALIIAGEGDNVSPVSEVQKVYDAAAPGSAWLVVQGATHEALPYFFEDLGQPVIDWLADEK